MQKAQGPRVPSSIRVGAAYYFWDHKERFQKMDREQREVYLQRLETQDPRKAKAMRGLFERHL